jgi:GDPmannose 4,6-dehydratase
MRNVIIVGSQGQDGRLLYERLAAEGCAVLGIDRRGIRHNAQAVDMDDAPVDVLDRRSVDRIVRAFTPDAVFYLAAFHQSSEEECPFDDAELYLRSHDVHVRGSAHFLETLRRHAPRARFFYAASSHCFGEASTSLQDESTPLRPVCPYGISKTAGVQLCRTYRSRHGLQASCGFLYNHESPLRSPSFLSAKIIRGAVEIARRRRDRLVLGDLSAHVDWGYAPDYIDAMIRIVRLDTADDFVIASGRAHSVGDFVSIAFAHLEIDWRRHLETDASLLTKSRPAAALVGDNSKLRRKTGWAPSVSFADMVRLLVDAELRRTADAAHPA